MRKIFITGGHYTPARAVIDLLLKQGRWEIYYVGRKYAMEDDKAIALEYQDLSSFGNLRYLSIVTGRLQRNFFINFFQSIRALFKIFIGFGQAFFWLLEFRPQVILSFGGYVAVPIVICGWLLRIPIVTHEQTVTSGLSNKIVALFARKILVAWSQSLAKFPKQKAVLVGNPIREEILSEVRKERRTEGRPFGTAQGKKDRLIYITGGNQGAHVINRAVEEALLQLLSKYKVVHQTGDSQTFKDFDRLSKRWQTLAQKQQENYKIVKFLGALEVAETLAKAELVVTRSGGNIVYELAALGKPAILIPIPWTGGDEQTKNARILADKGAALILPQEKLTGETLVSTIQQMTGKIEEYNKFAGECQNLVKLDAAERILKEITP